MLGFWFSSAVITDPDVIFGASLIEVKFAEKERNTGKLSRKKKILIEKKDATSMITECEGKFYKKVEIEDHYVVIVEPGCNYLSHMVPEDGSGVSIAEALHGVIKNKELEDSWM